MDDPIHSALSERLDEFESYLRGLPLELGREPALFPTFRGEFERHLRACEEVTKGLPRKLDRRAQKHSWAHSGHGLFLEAPVNWRAFHKPRGYAGDGELLDMFHRADYEGDTALGRMIHRVSMLQPAAQAVRNRAQLVRQGVERTLFDKGVHSRILSMGCGTSPELTQLVHDSPHFECPTWSWLGLDIDPETVNIARRRHVDPRLSFMEVNALELAKDPTSWMWGRFDFIYAVGIFDYFPLGIARPLTQVMFDNLAPGGRLWLGNFHPDNPTRWYMEYIAKWHLIHRSEDELMGFTDLFPRDSFKARIFWEAARSQIFLDVLKEA